jgi:hypothetical protein
MRMGQSVKGEGRNFVDLIFFISEFRILNSEFALSSTFPLSHLLFFLPSHLPSLPASKLAGISVMDYEL